MKVRSGYVSNSSSSSFMVFPEDLNKSDHFSEDHLRRLFSPMNEDWNGLFDDGEIRFGWQRRDYYDIESKWNWIVLQAFYDKQKNEDSEFWNDIVSFVYDMNPNLEIDLEDLKKKEYNFDIYIDHQSIEPEITYSQISSIGIYEWLENKECHVHNSNDNEYYEDE